MGTQSTRIINSRRNILVLGVIALMAVIAATLHATYSNRATSANVVTGQPAVAETESIQDTSIQPLQSQADPNPDTASQRLTAENLASSTTVVTVNGKKIEVPANGSYSETTVNRGVGTEVNVESKQSSDNAGSSVKSSSVQLNISSESYSSSSEEH